jgi:hypothetical protein
MNINNDPIWAIPKCSYLNEKAKKMYKKTTMRNHIHYILCLQLFFVQYNYCLVALKKTKHKYDDIFSHFWTMSWLKILISKKKGLILR